ncbi:MAG: nicotinamide-nucleotide amidohydrolase family protein [Aestuariibacter sp.]
MGNETSFVLAEHLGHLLQQKHFYITTAESCTAGGIAYAITDVAGSSNWFHQGFVTYSNESKHEQVGVHMKTLQDNGAVSSQVVAEMVQGAAKKAKAQVAVAVSGVAGPGGGTDDKPVGTVWFGFYLEGQVTTEKKQFSGDRVQVRQQTVEYALRKIILLLQAS